MTLERLPTLKLTFLTVTCYNRAITVYAPFREYCAEIQHPDFQMCVICGHVTCLASLVVKQVEGKCVSAGHKFWMSSVFYVFCQQDGTKSIILFAGYLMTILLHVLKQNISNLSMFVPDQNQKFDRTVFFCLFVFFQYAKQIKKDKMHRKSLRLFQTKVTLLDSFAKTSDSTLPNHEDTNMDVSC